MKSLYLLGFLAFGFTLLLTPVIRDLFLRLGLVDVPDNSRKFHRSPVPRIGGVSIFLSYLLAFGAVSILSVWLDAALTANLTHVSQLVIAVLVVFATGLADDLRSLKPYQKILGQTVAALVAYSGGVAVHVSKGSAGDEWLTLPLTVIWLVGCSNAFNLIDGLDGLAAGLGILGTTTVLIAAFFQHNLELAIVAVPLLGCLLGFIRYNYNPASLFLGDCGSLTIGFMLGCCGALWGQKSATLLGMIAPVVALSVPLLDTALALARRFLRRQPLFQGDRDHIHHRLLARGLTQKNTALMLYGSATVAAVFSLLANAMRHQYPALVLLAFCGVVALAVGKLGYLEFRSAGNLISKGRVFDLIDGEVRLTQFDQALQGAKSLTQCWDVLREYSRSLGFCGLRMSVQGAVTEEYFSTPELVWQVRIPLPADNYLNLYRAVEADTKTLPLAGLVTILRTTLRYKVTEYACLDLVRKYSRELPEITRSQSGYEQFGVRAI